MKHLILTLLLPLFILLAAAAAAQPAAPAPESAEPAPAAVSAETEPAVELAAATGSAAATAQPEPADAEGSAAEPQAASTERAAVASPDPEIVQLKTDRGELRLEIAGYGITLGNVTVEPESFQARVDGRELPLLKKEFDILAYFMQRPGHVIDKSVLAEAVWGDHIDQADSFNFVYSQMKNLRRKLEDAGATIEIKAVYGFGYKLVER